MRKIDILFEEYAQSHQNATNKFIHWMCVPLIFWSILGFISLIPSGDFYILGYGAMSWASLIALVFVTLFYMRLSLVISLLMLVLMLLMNYLSIVVNTAVGSQACIVYLSVFIITWILQFVGHKIEGKKPSFIKDLQFLLIGPIWLVHFILKKIGMKY
ncbi:MAG TPA: Mpo1-like protein [Flavobacterium sp.]|nr:Mpo1-like protein [Flavobacterium sp.]